MQFEANSAEQSLTRAIPITVINRAYSIQGMDGYTVAEHYKSLVRSHIVQDGELKRKENI